MLSPEDFLTTIYVLADDFCRSRPELVRSFQGTRGPKPRLTPSEVMALSLLAQWQRFGGERGFWRFAQQQLRPLLPGLTDRSQFNRASRKLSGLLASFFQHLAEELDAEHVPYEIIDRFGLATRRSGRRGAGWLPEYTDKGLCSRLGFFHGVQVLSAVTPRGVITGFGVAPGSTKDQPMAGAFFRARAAADKRSAPTAGSTSIGGIYIADMGFSGPNRHREWYVNTGALLICPPQEGHAPRWPAEKRRALASMRQMVETVHEKLLNVFRLENERPHAISGLFTRLCAKAALHNACMWINRQLGRPLLAFADLLAW